MAFLERSLARLSGIGVIMMMVLTTLDVIGRFAFNRPIYGAYEIQEVLVVFVSFLGLSYVQSQRMHIVMDLLNEILSDENQRIIQLLGDLIFICIAMLIAWQTGLHAWFAYVQKDFTWGIVHMPTWPPKLAISLGMGLLSLRLIYDVITNPLWQIKSGTDQKGNFVRLMVTIGLFILILAGIIVTKFVDLSPPTVGVVGLCLFTVLLCIGTPVGGTMIIIAVYGFWLLRGGNSALGVAATVPFSVTANYSITVIPLFILMGSFAAIAGFAENGFDLARKWLGGIPGGIAQATVLGATAFAAATGSALASVSVLARVAVPEMMRNGISKLIAIGVVSTASSLAIMIPPSNMFVVYGMMTGTSIGQLLIAGVIPGLIGMSVIMTMLFLRYKLDPKAAAALKTTHDTWKERFKAIPKAWGIFFVAVLVLGGIYTGIFTPTEAGAVGATISFIGMVIAKQAGWKTFSGAVQDSAQVCCSVLIILIGGMMFSNMMAVTRLPVLLSEWVASLDVAPITIIICIMLMYFILGTALDSISSMIITIPIIFPIVMNLGFSPLWFGVLMVQNSMIAEISPPAGMNLFVLKRLLPDTSMKEIFIAVTWFMIPLIITMIIYIAFPQVALWLPGKMSG
ncbi:MAG: TRAP transporter large permease subunit [Deltaproteobacteria bacterium]|nr:TRAP transporter large permease subunit [Deltaproteobacteria bacterium]